MRTVGIKLADGSFYPIMEEGTAQTKKLELTTANDNQTCVMVDLYRSKTCSMEDAEYIDTLKIENLNAHQNGEPSISFDVGLDENGELSASIADPETGATSNSQLTLVSRTAEERLVADDYSISGEETSVDEPVVEDVPAEEAPAEEDSGNGAAVAAGVVAGAGLLAAAGIMAAKNKDQDTEEPAGEDITAAEESFDDTEAPVEMTDDEIAEVTEDAGLDDFSFDDAPTTVTAAEDEGVESFSLDDTPSEDTIADEIITDDAAETEDFTAADEGLASFNPEETAAEDATFADDATLTEDATVADDATIADDTLPDMDFDMPENTTQAADDSLGIADDSLGFADGDLDLGDDSFDIPEDTTQTEDDSFDLPDDTTIPGDETILEDETFAAPAELTDTSDTTDTDDFFNDIDSEPTPSPAEGLNFTGLYDKETEMGESSVHDDEDINKKTRAPVIICIICAIICIIATILVLLVVPGKFNLIQKRADKKSQTSIEKQAETPAPAPAEEKKPDPVPQAKEDEVVVIEKAEEVKPLPPPAAETKSKDVSYKIKWGDTLWDIADTYYKNPWRYKKIANYNNIKNPDHIISGTIILIPSE
jgi:hypothetical protein